MSPAQAVSALRASVPSVARRFAMWLGPFGSAILGMFVLMVAVAGEKPSIFVGVVGGLIVLGAFEANADRAKTREAERWAKWFAKLIADDKRAEIRIEHTVESIRPEIDELVERLVAQAIEARRAETGTGSVADESAVGSADAPTPSTPTGEERT